MPFCLISNSYIAKRICKPFLLIFIVISLLTWFSQSIRILEIVSQSNEIFISFLKMSLYITPYLWYLIIPIAVLITVVNVAHYMTNHKEILIMQSLGMTKWQIAKPIILLSICITVVHYTISLYIMSTSYHRFRDLQLEMQQQYGLALLAEHVFATQIPGITIYVGKKNGINSLEQIFVDDSRDMNKQITMTAESGSINQNELGEIVLFLQNGSYQEYHKKNTSNPILTFDKYQMVLPIQGEGSAERRFDAHEQPAISMLFSENTKAKAYGHQRVVWPLYSLVITSICLGLFLSPGRRPRNSAIYSMLLCLLLIAISFLLQGLAIKLSATIILMYFVPILSLLIALTRLIYDE